MASKPLFGGLYGLGCVSGNNAATELLIHFGLMRE